MTLRGSLRESLRRGLTVAAKGIISKPNDKKKMQEVKMRMGHSEYRDGVERFQSYGHSSVPMEPTGGPDGMAAEAIYLRIGSHMTHTVIIATDDRRFRPTGMKGGDVAMSDHRQQGQFISEKGVLNETHLPINSQVVKHENQEDEKTSRDRSQVEWKPMSSHKMDDKRISVIRTDPDTKAMLSEVFLDHESTISRTPQSSVAIKGSTITDTTGASAINATTHVANALTILGGNSGVGAAKVAGSMTGPSGGTGSREGGSMTSAGDELIAAPASRVYVV